VRSAVPIPNRLCRRHTQTRILAQCSFCALVTRRDTSGRRRSLDNLEFRPRFDFLDGNCPQRGCRSLRCLARSLHSCVGERCASYPPGMHPFSWHFGRLAVRLCRLPPAIPVPSPILAKRALASLARPQHDALLGFYILMAPFPWSAGDTGGLLLGVFYRVRPVQRGQPLHLHAFLSGVRANSEAHPPSTGWLARCFDDETGFDNAQMTCTFCARTWM
jgi:hypothetical protein